MTITRLDQCSGAHRQGDERTGRHGRFLLDPYGPHWSERRASDLLEVDADGTVIGAGEVEQTAFSLHAAVHAARPDANCVVHTHMPYATALAVTEEGFDTRASQNAARFHGGRYVYHRDYGGLFTSPDECRPIAEQIAAGVRVVLLRNHGVLVVGETVARVWWDSASERPGLTSSKAQRPRCARRPRPADASRPLST
jgi:ribulose-5-phosphate 4-epimerase/fuculose-1-phosphate aldolase